MIDFTLTDEQKMMQKTAHDFSVNEIRPVASFYDEKEEFPYDLVKKASHIGLTSFYLPEKYGGGGIEDYITQMIVMEELCWGCAGIATSIMGTGLAATAIIAMGNEEQKERFIKLFCDKENVRLGAMAITEPQAGSDFMAITTSAKKEEGYYILNGTKCFITNGGIADLHVILAVEDKKLGLSGFSAFVVEKGTAGLTMGRKEKKMGVRASHTAEVYLQDCKVPESNKLGLGNSSAILGALKMLDISRPIVGSGAVGIARAAFEYALDYSKKRIQMKKPINRLQAIGFKLADMAIKIEAARMLCWKAGWMANKGIPFNRGEGSMAKCFAGDVAMSVTTEAVQILGGYGYMKDYPLEKWMRDAKLYQIWEGTAEIQRVVISRMLRI